MRLLFPEFVSFMDLYLNFCYRTVDFVIKKTLGKSGPYDAFICKILRYSHKYLSEMCSEKWMKQNLNGLRILNRFLCMVFDNVFIS